MGTFKKSIHHAFVTQHHPAVASAWGILRRDDFLRYLALLLSINQITFSDKASLMNKTSHRKVCYHHLSSCHIYRDIRVGAGRSCLGSEKSPYHRNPLNPGILAITTAIFRATNRQEPINEKENI